MNETVTCGDITLPRIIPWYRRKGWREESLRLILLHAQRQANEQSSREVSVNFLSNMKSPSLFDIKKQYSKSAPLKNFDVFLAYCEDNGRKQCKNLEQLLIDEGFCALSNDDSLTPEEILGGIRHCRFVILFLTDHVMESSNVQNQIREARKVCNPLLLVNETNPNHGAPLNQDKGFDFTKVCSEQPPDDLKNLHYGIESSPYIRGFELVLVRDIVKKATAQFLENSTTQDGKILPEVAESMTTTEVVGSSSRTDDIQLDLFNSLSHPEISASIFETRRGVSLDSERLESSLGVSL